jgi:hypothetical protein
LSYCLFSLLMLYCLLTIQHQQRQRTIRQWSTKHNKEN